METVLLAVLVVPSLPTMLNPNTFQSVFMESHWLAARGTIKFKTSSISLCAIHAAKKDRNLPFGVFSGSCQVVTANSSKERHPYRLFEKTPQSAQMYITKDRAEDGET